MEKYINSIFEKQSETDIRQLLYSFATENDHSKLNIANILANQLEFCGQNPWGDLTYSKGQIKEMLNQIVNT